MYIFWKFRPSAPRGIKTAPVLWNRGCFAFIEPLSYDALAAGILDGSLGPCYRNIATEMGTFRGAIIPEQGVLNPPYPDK